MVQVVGVRMTGDEVAKLDELAQATQRDRSKVLRLLLAQARLDGYEIQLGGKAA